MAKKNYYAVKVGHHPNIYKTWAECQAETKGFSGAEFKGFETLKEAEEYMCGLEVKLPNIDTTEAQTMPSVYAFVDGSFNPETNVYGYGGFLMCDGIKHILQGNGNELEMASMRNVAGEVLGSQAGIQKAIDLGCKEIVVYYDYMGIEMWATGSWKRNKVGTKQYFEFIKNVESKINISFVHVKGHSGVDGNEEADKLAKESVGI